MLNVRINESSQSRLMSFIYYLSENGWWGRGKYTLLIVECEVNVLKIIVMPANKITDEIGFVKNEKGEVGTGVPISSLDTLSSSFFPFLFSIDHIFVAAVTGN